MEADNDHRNFKVGRDLESTEAKPVALLMKDGSREEKSHIHSH